MTVPGSQPASPAYMAAMAVALSARTNMLTGHAVEDMRTKAEELLPRGDDMRQAILSFAAQYELHRHDPGSLRILGDGLERALHDALMLDRLRPRPLPERKDLDG